MMSLPWHTLEKKNDMTSFILKFMFSFELTERICSISGRFSNIGVYKSCRHLHVALL